MKSRSSSLRLVQCHVLFRHGDRTPGFNCLEPLQPDAALEVAAWWRELLQKVEMNAVRKMIFSQILTICVITYIRVYCNVSLNSHVFTHIQMQRAFPVQFPENTSSEPRDRSMGVFGSLTNRGKRQMWALGHGLRSHFEEGGLFEGIEPEKQFSLVKAYASNYSRTQLSAQATLAGIFGLQADGTLDTNESLLRPPPKSWFGMTHVPVADLPLSRTVPVTVLPPEQEYINIYPFSKELQSEMRQVMIERAQTKLSEEEQIKESRWSQVKKEITESVPAFAYNLQPFSWSSSLDILACRRSRKSVSRDGRRSRLFMTDVISNLFSTLDLDGNGVIDVDELRDGLREMACDWLSDADLKNINSAAQSVGGQNEEDGVTLSQLTHLLQSEPTNLATDSYVDGVSLSLSLSIRPTNHTHTHTHTHHRYYEDVCAKMCDQFELWYNEPHILRRVLRPMVSRIMDPMLEATKSTQEYPRVVLHSGHDISILPWLHLLDAWTSAAGWPEYSAAIRLDLLRRLDDDKMFVRITYNKGFTDSESSDYVAHFEPIMSGLLDSNEEVVSLDDVIRFFQARQLMD